jgi:hypothetical protein
MPLDMPQYLLECPRCLGRTQLDEVHPGARERCKKCRAVLLVPVADGVKEEEGRVEPDRRRRSIQLLGIWRLAAVAIGSMSLLVGVGWWIGAVQDVGEGGGARPGRSGKRPDRPIRAEDLKEFNVTSPWPLAAGWRWVYESGQAEEERWVSASYGGADETSCFDLKFQRGDSAKAWSLAVRGDGIYLLSETREGVKWQFRTPLRWFPVPLLADDEWVCEAEAWAGEGESAVGEVWTIRCRSAVERVTTEAGTWLCTRVDLSGQAGGRGIADSWWMARGVGPVKFQEGTREWVLASLMRP